MVILGEQAPDVVLRTIDGESVRLRGFVRNKKTLLVFYRGSWCPMCNFQIGKLEEDRTLFEEWDVQIVAISTDTPEGATKTLKEMRAQFPILLDPDHSAIHAFGIHVTKREFWDLPSKMHRKRDYAMPSVFLLAEDGTLMYQYIGKSFTDRPENDELINAVSEGIPAM